MHRPVRGLVLVLAAALLAGCGGGASSSAASPAPTAAAATAAATTPPATAVAATPVSTAPPDYMVVAVGDSIPYNSSQDCPSCRGFVTLYANGLAKASGKSVGVNNLSQHNSLTVAGLLLGLTNEQNRIDAVSNADVVIVGIAHNDTPMNSDIDSCDGAGGELPDWSKFTDACIAAEVATFTPKYEAVYARIAELRAGKPTILRTINRYNDWNGWPGHDLSSAGLAATVKIIKAWNEMICAAAVQTGFLCADISTVINGADGKAPSGSYLAADYTHPSQKGNDAIAQALIDLGYEPLFP